MYIRTMLFVLFFSTTLISAFSQKMHHKIDDEHSRKDGDYYRYSDERAAEKARYKAMMDSIEAVAAYYELMLEQEANAIRRADSIAAIKAAMKKQRLEKAKTEQPIPMPITHTETEVKKESKEPIITTQNIAQIPEKEEIAVPNMNEMPTKTIENESETPNINGQDDETEEETNFFLPLLGILLISIISIYIYSQNNKTKKNSRYKRKK